MAQFNLGEARTHFSALVRRALAGEEIIIARNNKPLLRLAPLDASRQPRQPGSARGQVWMSEDFEEIPGDFEKLI